MAGPPKSELEVLATSALGSSLGASSFLPPKVPPAAALNKGSFACAGAPKRPPVGAAPWPNKVGLGFSFLSNATPPNEPPEAAEKILLPWPNKFFDYAASCVFPFSSLGALVVAAAGAKLNDALAAAGAVADVVLLKAPAS